MSKEFQKLGVWSGLFVVLIISVLLLSHWFARSHKDVSPFVPASGIFVTKLADDSQMIRVPLAGYKVTVPDHWYFESRASGTAAFYPEYDPTASSTPRCKVELSVFEKTANKNFMTWVVDELHSDPITVVSDSTIVTSTVEGMPAIRWTGLFDGIESELVYIEGNRRIYEFAPSPLAPETPMAACVPYLDTILNSFRIDQ